MNTKVINGKDGRITMITTTRGPMDPKLLKKEEGVERDNDNEYTVVTQYWLDGEVVHRSVSIQLKQGLAAMIGVKEFTF